MFVACPACKSLYSITADQLRLAEGQVRCGQCGLLFNATHAVFADPHQALQFDHPLHQEMEREIDELVDRALGDVTDTVEDLDAALDAGPGAAPEEPLSEAGQAVPEPEPAPGDEETVVGTAVETRGESFAGADAYAHPVAGEFVAPSAGADETLHQPGAATPEEAPDIEDLSEVLLFHDAEDRGSDTRWGAIAAALLLTVTLIAQYAWWDRNQLVQFNGARPVLEWLCRPLRCHLPLRHDLTKMEMVEREVRDHPNVPGALLISAAFANRASFRQAYPVLQISFSNISGTPVAVRRFRPREYLHDKNPARGMAPGEEALVTLEVVDPGKSAVSFQFDFL